MSEFGIYGIDEDNIDLRRYNESIENMCTMNKYFKYMAYVVRTDENCNLLKEKYKIVKKIVKING